MRKLKIRLYGPFSATWTDGQALEINSSKIVALLAMLATAPEGMRTRAWLQGQLWSLSGAELGRASLRRALSDLRKLFGSDFERMFKVSNSRICLKPDAILTIGAEADGVFLEGIDVAEPAFQSWLDQMRASSAVDRVKSTELETGSERNFSSPSVAVIPFSFLQGEEPGSMMGDAFAQEMTRMLAKAKLFVVYSHLLGRKFSQASVDLSDMARNHAVDFVVYGTIKSDIDELKVDVDIASTRTGRLCSTQAFSVPLSDLLKGSLDFMDDLGRHAAEAIVLAMVEQKLLDQKPDKPTAATAHGHHDLDMRAHLENAFGSGRSFDTRLSRRSEGDEFRAWLSRWYIEHLENSGIEAIRLKSSETARKCFQKALDVAEELGGQAERERTINRLLLLLGPQMFINHGFASEKVQEVYERARRRLPSDSDRQQRLQTLWGLWGAELVKAEIAVAETLCGEFLQAAGEGCDALEGTVGGYMTAVCAFYKGGFESAGVAFEHACRSSQTVKLEEAIPKYGMDVGLIARCYQGWCHALTGQTEKAVQTSRSAALAASQLEHPFSQALGYCILATMHNFLDDIQEARRFALLAKELCQTNGFAQQEAHAQINLGRVIDREGDPRGLQMMLDGQSAYADTQAALARAYTDAWIAEALLVRQEPRDALKRLLDARRFTRKSGETYFDAELLRLTGLAIRAARPGQERRSEFLLQSAADLAGKTGAKLHLMKALDELTRLQNNRRTKVS